MNHHWNSRWQLFRKVKVWAHGSNAGTVGKPNFFYKLQVDISHPQLALSITAINYCDKWRKCHCRNNFSATMLYVYVCVCGRSERVNTRGGEILWKISILLLCSFTCFNYVRYYLINEDNLFVFYILLKS